MRRCSCFKSDSGLFHMAFSQEKIDQLCIFLKDDPQSYMKLLSEVNISLCNDEFEFERSCECLIALVYFDLCWDRTNSTCSLHSTLQLFIGRCFDCCPIENLCDLIPFLSSSRRTSQFGFLVMISAHYFNYNITDECLRSILLWSSGPEAPSWLRDVSGCFQDDSYKWLNALLYQSLTLRNPETLTVESGYLKALLLFLKGCQDYSSRNYENSLETLTSINIDHCGDYLLSLCNLFSGLNLENLGRPKAAMLKYKKALNSSNKCWISVFYTARILKDQSFVAASLEALTLLTEVTPEVFARDDTSFQGVLLNVHFPPVSHVALRARWVLAITCFTQKMFDEAKLHYTKLLDNYPEVVVNTSNHSGPELLCDSLPEEDKVPPLPQLPCIRVGLALALVMLKEYEEIETLLKNVGESDFISVVNSEAILEDQQISIVSTVASRLLLAEALYHLDNVGEAMNQCVGLLLPMETIGGLPDSTWTKTYTLVKASLYSLMALLFTSRGNIKNSLHYQRLHRQCLDIWSQDENQNSIKNPYYRLIIDNIASVLGHNVLNSRNV